MKPAKGKAVDNPSCVSHTSKFRSFMAASLTQYASIKHRYLVYPKMEEDSRLFYEISVKE
jgi:hypothetical protein